MEFSLDVLAEYRIQCEIALNAFTFKLNAQKFLVLNRLSFYFKILFEKIIHSHRAKVNCISFI